MVSGTKAESRRYASAAPETGYMLCQIFISIGLLLGSAVEDRTSAAARLKKVEADLAIAEAVYEKAASNPRDSRQENGLVEQAAATLTKQRASAYAAAFEIAREAPTSQTSFDALEWLLMHAPAVYRYGEAKEAIELLTRHYAADPRIARVIGKMALHPPVGLPLPQEQTHISHSPAYAPAMELFKAVEKLNPDRKARAQAEMGLAIQATYACEFLDFRGRPSGRLRADAEAELTAIITRYGDVPCVGVSKYTPTLPDRARVELFQLQQLRPGQSVPDITGQDLDGRTFRLSDYRGKVVVLVFWASWCGPCMAMVPHERELLDRYKGKPFALVGVNGDENKANALTAITKNQVAWRSFWNGPDGAYGPINTAWNIHSLPTVYLIDQKGVIRSIAMDTKELDEQVPGLVTEAEAAARRE